MTEGSALLTSCDRELIHVPGSIQPHGLLLVTDRETLRVRHVAGDVEGRLGITGWDKLLLEHVLGGSLAGRAAALVRSSITSGFIGQLAAASGETFDVSAHFSGHHLMIELEPASPSAMPASVRLDHLEAAASVFERSGSLQALCERAAIAFHSLTEFDRVMVYHFLDDDAGRVLAEARRADTHAFLNHHFPASDIPRQARALYVRNLTRVIPNITYQPAALRPAWTGTDPLDMSDSSLRSVSPIHLQYLSNMGVVASASVSIVRDGKLWGLIACHNQTPRLMPYDVRAACRALAGTLARQIKAKDEAEGYRQRIRLRSFEEDIIRLLSRDGTLDLVLSNHMGELRRMFDADGVVVLRGDELVSDGVTPSTDAVRRLATWVSSRTDDSTYATNWLEEAYPDAHAFRATGSGLLAVTMLADQPWLVLWFRIEKVEVVNWAGNPHDKETSGVDGILTPRTSFEAWQEMVRGRARPWSVPQIEAARRLRRGLLEVLQNRRVKQLNRQLTQILHDKDQLLEQKDFLIGEVNHRVQNSLQLVSSFLSQQGRASRNPEVGTALDEARRRLSAIALVHRRLYHGDQLQVVDMARYIEELGADTVTAMGQEWARHLSLELAPLTIPIDRAVALGLVLTELVINANKYAYGGTPGPLEVRLTVEEREFQLSVADKGGGRATSRKGFGSRMIDGLVVQLGGTLVYSDNLPGLRAVLTAPIARLPGAPHAGHTTGGGVAPVLASPLHPDEP